MTVRESMACEVQSRTKSHEPVVPTQPPRRRPTMMRSDRPLCEVDSRRKWHLARELMMALPLSYNWRNLWVRRLSTSLTLVVVTVVVLVLAVLLSFAEGIRASLKSSGAPDNVIVLKPGALAESTSVMLPEELVPLTSTPYIAADGGEPMISRELSVQQSIPRTNGDGLANVAIRGVDPVAFKVHSEVRIYEGRCFEPAQPELIIGKSAATRYAGLRIGDSIRIGRDSNRNYKIVGLFEARGGAFESEMWGPRSSLADSYHARYLSSVALRLDDPRHAPQTLEYLNGPSVRLNAKVETAYYDELTSQASQIAQLAGVLVGIMAIGAAFAVANTMFAAVDGRRREIAMLRTIGFARSSVVSAFMIESVMVCLCGCALGLGLSLLLNGVRQDFLSNVTWTVLAYELRITPRILGLGLGLSLAVGFMGAMFPALRAARIGIIEALRKA